MIGLNTLKKGDRAIIKDILIDQVPLSLLEIGCLPGNELLILGLASKKGPIYIKVDQSHISIDIITASKVLVELK